MAFPLLLVALAMVTCLTAALFKDNWRVIAVKTSIVFSMILWAITESLSVFKALNFTNIALSWTFVIVASSFLFFKYRPPNFRNHFRLPTDLTTFEKRVFYCILGLLTTIFVQGLVYPPNNWDSLSYHLTRVVFWISNETVDHYPAQDYRQIHQSPFGEYVLLHFNLLFGGDALGNSLQCFFLALTAIAGSLVGKELGLNRKYQLLTAFFIITIPQIIIQASSTKNDILALYFIVTSFWFILRYIKKKELSDFLFLGLAVGLAMLVKTTTYLFLAPILLGFALWFLYFLYQTQKWSLIGLGILAGTSAILINAPFFYRNYQISNNILAVDPAADNGYSNTEINLSAAISNITRNISLHLAPFPLSKASEWSVKKLHDLLDIDVNNPNTTFGFTKYKVTNYPNGEGDSPNLLHFLLSLISLAYLTARNKELKSNKKLFFLAAVVLIQFLLFCLYLKWQPWHTRLHLPIFVLACPLLAFYLQHKSKALRLEKLIVLSFGIYAAAICLFSANRPLISVSGLTSDIAITDDREKKLFISLPILQEDYQRIKQTIADKKFQSTAALNVFDLEYLLYNNLYESGVKIYNAEVNNYSRAAYSTIPTTPDCLISRKNQPTIQFQNQIYKNLNLLNTHVFLYVPQGTN